MILNVTKELKSEVLAYLYNDEDFNVLLIGQLLHYDINHNYHVFIQYEEGVIRACFDILYTRAQIYSRDQDFNPNEIAQILNSYQLDRIGGRKETIDLLSPFLNHKKGLVEFNYSKLSNDELLIKSDFEFSNAQIEDLPKIFDYIKSTIFLKSNYIDINTMKLNLKAGRIYYIEEQGRVVASGETSIETPKSALIGEVSTFDTLRNRGIATKLASKLCHDVLKEQKIPYLFYNNPSAASIYHKLGFIDIGIYSMFVFEHKN